MLIGTGADTKNWKLAMNLLAALLPLLLLALASGRP